MVSPTWVCKRHTCSLTAPQNRLAGRNSRACYCISVAFGLHLLHEAVKCAPVVVFIIDVYTTHQSPNERFSHHFLFFHPRQVSFAMSSQLPLS
jgi:hypothetical protein